MTFTINMVDASGKVVRVVEGEALPLYERMPPPVGLTIEIDPDDIARLKKGFLRFLRAAHAGHLMGDVSLTFAHNIGFRAEPAPNTNAVKFFALECRPFFLEKDPLAFSKLLNLRSLTAAEPFRPSLKRHRQRWENSAFGGVMSVQVNGKKLDTHHVVETWFNCDIFHSEPQRPEEFSLEALFKDMGGEAQAVSILANHLIESVRVLDQFFNDLRVICSDFDVWATAELAKTPP
jgi:hypothetical protein